MTRADSYDGMLAETVTIRGYEGDVIPAYFARPLGAGPYPGVVVIHHMPGWDEWSKEVTRTFAASGLRRAVPAPAPPRRARRELRRRGEGRARGGRRTRRTRRRRRRGRGRGAARAPEQQRQGRRDRSLLRWSPRVAGRVPGRHRRRHRLLRRRRRHARRPAQRPDAGRADRPHPRHALPAARPVRQRGSASLAGTGRACRKKRCAPRARTSSSTATTTPVTRSSARPDRCTASKPRSTRGRASGTSSAATWPRA